MRFLLVFSLMLLGGASFGQAANPPQAMAETNAQETLRAFLQLQEQLHANQLAIEAARKDAEDAATKNNQALAQSSQTLTARLQSIEEALTRQRAEELKSLQSSTRTMLMLAGAFAVLGIGAMLLMGFLQWRTVNRLAEISSASGWRSLGPGPDTRILAEGAAGPSHPVREVNAQLASALGQLEKRILGLEERTRHPLPEPVIESVSSNGNGERHNGHETKDGVGDLLARGQALLEKENAADALALFEEVIKSNPENADAYVRKGSALEKLGRLDDAIATLDKAIALDDSLTLAYLHKGGLLNRTERFAEALECYEKALRTQEKNIA